MTISQELEQRSIMVTYSSGQIVGIPGENHVNADNIEAIEGQATSIQGNIHAEQTTTILSPYKSLNDPKAYDHETEANDNQIPISGVHQLDYEGNVCANQWATQGNGNPVVNDQSLQSYLLQRKLFQDSKPLISYQGLDNTAAHTNLNYPEHPAHQEINIANTMAGSYDKERNILIATETSIPEQTVQSIIESCSLSQGDNNNVAVIEPNNIAMMIQHRPIAPAHASPVVYAEPANTAILSSSAVHHQIFGEEGKDNNGEENVDNNDTRKDFLKEQALEHGFESGV